MFKNIANILRMIYNYSKFNSSCYLSITNFQTNKNLKQRSDYILSLNLKNEIFKRYKGE